MNSRPYEYSYLWTCPLIFKFVFNHFLSLSGVIKPCRLDCHATRDEFSSILFSVFMPLLVINIRANWLKPKTTCSFRFWLIFTSNGSFQINSTLIRLGSATPQKSVIMLISYGTVISSSQNLTIINSKCHSMLTHSHSNASDSWIFCRC